MIKLSKDWTVKGDLNDSFHDIACFNCCFSIECRNGNWRCFSCKSLVPKEIIKKFNFLYPDEPYTGHD